MYKRNKWNSVQNIVISISIALKLTYVVTGTEIYFEYFLTKHIELLTIRDGPLRPFLAPAPLQLQLIMIRSAPTPLQA
jgi:hypothetical protein